MTWTVINHLWQSTLFAIAAGLLTLIFRKDRARVRYGLWFSASCKFFIPFSLLMTIGNHIGWMRAGPTAAVPYVLFKVDQITQPFPEAFRSIPSGTGTVPAWPSVVMITVWVCGFIAIAVGRFQDWLRVRAMVRSSSPLAIVAPLEVRSAPGLDEPGVIGIFRPVLVLPEGILDRLTPLQLKAILEHEFCHIRRRDNLTSAIHMILEAALWFHPLVWWIGGRLLQERERACDEAVLTLGSQPQDYAGAILKVWKAHLESRLSCACGIAGSDARKRIDAILTRAVPRNLNVAKKLVLALSATSIFVIPIVLGISNAKPVHAQALVQLEPAVIQSDPAGASDSTDISTNATQSSAQSGSATSSCSRLHFLANKFHLPGFKIAEIISCEDNTISIRLSRSEARSGGGLLTGSGALIGDNETVQQLMESAFHVDEDQVVGGPNWLRAERYDIVARQTASQPAGLDGPPPQQSTSTAEAILLEILSDRFKLAVHRERRPLQGFDLVVAESGPKMLESFAYRDLDSLRLIHIEKGRIAGEEVPVATLAKILSDELGCPVFDETGLRAHYHVELDWHESADSPASAISEALKQQLGLEIRPKQLWKEFIVVDHVQRPSLN